MSTNCFDRQDETFGALVDPEEQIPRPSRRQAVPLSPRR